MMLFGIYVVVLCGSCSVKELPATWINGRRRCTNWLDGKTRYLSRSCCRTTLFVVPDARYKTAAGTAQVCINTSKTTPGQDIPVVTGTIVSLFSIESARRRHVLPGMSTILRNIEYPQYFGVAFSTSLPSLGRVYSCCCATCTSTSRANNAKTRTPPLSCRTRTCPSAPRFESRTADEAPAHKHATGSAHGTGTSPLSANGLVYIVLHEGFRFTSQHWPII